MPIVVDSVDISIIGIQKQSFNREPDFGVAGINYDLEELLARWPLDTPIKNLITTGLPAPSIIRLKLFTLDNRLILAKLGLLASADQVVIEQRLKTLFCW